MPQLYHHVFGRIFKRRKKMIKSILLVIISATLICFIACESDSPTETDQVSQITFYLTDIPASYDSVNITFSEVSAHIDSQWIDVPVGVTTVNLLDYTNGTLLALGGINVQPGKYTQTRIKIDDAVIGVGDTALHLDVPSGAQTGLKFGPQFTIEEGVAYKVVIDFDAQQSIVTTGPPVNPKGYKLKPHIRVSVEGENGSVGGLVLNPSDVPAAYAVMNDDTVNTTMVDISSGHFLLGFLDVGYYKVIISDTLGRQSLFHDVMVNAGEKTELGSFSLQ
jgi:hypothetical protein